MSSGRFAKFGRLIIALTLSCFVLGASLAQAGEGKERKVIAKLNVLPGEESRFQALFEAFEEKTGINVEHRQAPGSMVNKWAETFVEVAGGLSPDLTTSRLDFVGQAAIGLIAPLDPFLEKDREGLSNIVPVLLKPLQWKGQQWVLPYGASAVVMMYNWVLFDEAGVAYPPAVWNDPAWTFERFVADMKKLTKVTAEGVVAQFGFAGPPWDSWLTAPGSWGGDWVDLERRKFMGDDPRVLRSLQDIQDLAWVHHVMPQAGESGGGLAGFQTGKVAMGGLGTWYLPQITRSGVPMTMAPWFKVGDRPPAGHVYPDGLVILRTAPNKEEAWEFLKFVTMDPRGNALRNFGAGVPGVAAIGTEWMRQQEAVNARMNSAIVVEQAAHYPVFPSIMKVTTYTDIVKIMNPAVTAVVNNKVAPAQAMEEVAGAVQALIDQSLH